MSILEKSPLSRTQMGVFTENMSFQESTLYNIPFLGKLPEDVCIEQLKKSIRKAFAAHPGLNVRIFMDENGEITQQVSKEDCHIEVIETTDEEFERLKNRLVRPFDLVKEALYRFEIYITSSAAYFFQDIHHIIFDGVSVGILSRDIGRAYGGEDPESEKWTVLDVALEEEKNRVGEELLSAKEYYSKLLGGLDCECLPVRDTFGKEPCQKWLNGEFKLNKKAFSILRSEAGISTAAFFTSVMGFLAAKYNYRNDSVITTVYTGRKDERAANTIGMLVKTLPFVTDINGNPSICNLLEKATKDLDASRKNDLFSFGEIAAEYGVTTDISFVYHGRITQYRMVDGLGMEVERVYDEKHIEKAALLVEVSDLGDGTYGLHVGYRGDIFSRGFAKNLMESYIRITEEFLEKEFADEIELIGVKAAAQMDAFNTREYPFDTDKTIVDHFRCQASKRPDKRALVYLNHSYTYRKLDELTDHLAMHLVKMGVGRESIVGVLIPRCEYMIIASLGILKAGAAYMPLDPSYPPERLNLMMEDSGAGVLITTPELSDIIRREHGCQRIMTDEIPQMQDIGEKLPTPETKDLFVLLYTSGSTGIPKGVMLEHGNVAALCDWTVRHYEINEDSVGAEYASYGFDAHMNDTYPQLISGGCVHIIDESIRLDLIQLQKYFNEQGITHTTMTTQVGRQFALMEGTEGLCHLTVGGEKLVPFDPPAYRFHNAYGPTEGTMCATIQVLDQRYEDVPIGVGMPNLKLYVVDPFGKLLPPGAAGELWISGRQVARGYLNRPEQTEKAFTRNPFSSEKEYSRVYHTGDVVRYMEDGRLQFIGRRDSQVKIRGFRIELTEVEEVIRRFPGIKNATVVAFDEANGGKYLAGYIVADETISIADLKTFIMGEKPPYMVPAVIMQIEAIPMTQNQKVNKRALPTPVKQEMEMIEPETEIQKRLFECVADAVGHREFGITTDVYEAGLTSIGSIRLNVLISREFDITIKTADLKNSPTIQLLEKFVLNSGSSEEYEIHEDYALTNAQLGVFADSASNPGSTVYNIPMLFELDDQVDLFRLKEAIEAAVEAHPYLKMQLFTDPVGEVRQKRKDQLPVKVSMLDQIEIDKLVRPFELYNCELYRFELYNTTEKKYFFMDIHHIAADGTALMILLKDINAAYEGTVLVKERYSGYEVALDYEKTIGSDAFARAEEFYSVEFGDCEGDTPFCKDLSEREPGAGNYRFSDKRLTPEAIRAYCEKMDITENVFFMGIFGLILSKYNYTDEAVFTTIYHGRNDSRMVETAAMLVKTLPVRTKISGSTADYFRNLKELLLGLMDHDCYPFSEISRSYNILPNTLFVYQGDEFTFDTVGGYPAKQIPLKSNMAKEPVTMQVFIREGRFVYEVEYRRDLYSTSFIENMAAAYAKAVWECLIKDDFAQIEIADEKAVEQIEGFNRTEEWFDTEKTILDSFREVAVTNPEHTALVYLDHSYTYRQLDEITDRLAMHLKQCGIHREEVVGVLIPRSEYMVICSLGILKAGGAYLPLDPTYPPERLNLMMEDSGAKVLITTPELNDVIHNEKDLIRLMTQDIPNLADNGEDLPLPRKEDLFVMLYTSGSTGIPKGVMLEHGNLAAFCAWARRYYQMDEKTVSAVYASYGFDAHMTDTYPPLTAGGCVHIVDESIRLDLIELQKYYNEKGITHSLITTQVGRQFACLEGTLTLKHLTVGGEKLVPLDPPAYHLYNAYGPTECTIMVTIAKVDQKYEDVPIGPAIRNIKLYVVDQKGKLLPPGASGELWISGRQVARCYRNRPEQTASVFTKNPFSTEEGYERVYHTGDVVRFQQDGTVQFMGRQDGQVKIRGFRIELTEVEEVIRRFPGIKDATVVARDAAAGGKMLVAYIVADQPIDIKAMNAFIQGEKPAYMVPAVTMQIDRIPLNANAKVDRKKLPEPVIKPSYEETDKERKKTRLEEEISDLLKTILGHCDFGVETDFAYAGLTSVSAIRLAAELNRHFGFSPNVKELLSSDILAVEDAIVSKWRQSAHMKEPEGKAIEQSSYPLTQTQLGIYLECLKDTESDMYNIPILIRLDTSVDGDRLERAIYTAVKAHPFLLCQIEGSSDGSARMLPRRDYQWRVLRTSCSRAEVESYYTGLTEPITLNGEALFKFEIIQTKDHLYLRMNFHHIIMDGSSVNILMEDIESAYREENLEPEKYTSFQLALDEQKERETKAYERAKEYYRSVFDGVSVRSLPNPDTAGLKEGETLCKFSMKELRRETVDAFCEKYQVTPNALFTAAFGILLARMTGQDEAVFASIYNGRNDPRTFRMLGMLVKTYPVYVKPDPKIAAGEFVRNVRESIQKLTANDLYSFAEASRAFDLSGEIMFAYQGDEFVTRSFAGKPAEYIDTKLQSTKAALNVDVVCDKNGFSVNIEYRSDLYAPESIHWMADGYEQIVQGLCNEKTLDNICIASKTARAYLEKINDTEWPVEFRPACRLMEENAEMFPDRLAIIAGDEKLTYSELNRQANRLAHGLIDSGILPGSIVALMLPRCAGVYISRQGILKAGAAFLPIDPKYPDDRIAYMLRDSGAAGLIVNKELSEERRDFLSSLGCPVFRIEELLNHASENNPGIDREADDICYCIYTSGSTGKPKGVLLSQKNLVNFADANPKNHEILGYTQRGRVSLAQAAFTFDVSVMEEFIPLANGMTICMANEEEIHNPMALARLMLENGVDIMSCTPSFLSNIIDLKVMQEPLRNVKAYDFGAEAFPPSLYHKIRAIYPDAHIMNGYGPTEATISCTMDVVTNPDRITIGRPNANVKAYVVDENMQILPPRMKGELVICGEGVGLGYIGRKDLTKEKFITLEGIRAYRTGDLAEYSHDGLLIFHGRTDNQVKLRGLRVELGEIENAINTYPGIITSIVQVCGEGTHQFLAAWFSASKDIDLSDLKEQISKTLTHYMVPSVLKQIPAMPLTANGKIDKKRLPEPEYTHTDRLYLPPANEVEADFCALFADILDLERVGAEDHFFELGGTSLSASRIAMFAIEKGYKVVYADVFRYPTPRGLAALVLNQKPEPLQNKKRAADYDYQKLEAALSENILQNLDEIQSGQIGNVLITGATGFLAIHVLWRYLESCSGTAYCLLRRGKLSSVEKRLRGLLAYYFSDDFEEYFANGRIRCVEGDITNPESLRQLEDLNIQTVINCAALVKHFDAGDELERVNVQGVKNLIDCCKGRDRRLIQISTVSIAGESINGTPEEGKQLHENELFFGQYIENDYVESKYQSERAVLEAIIQGLDAKIMRVGNLMARHTDGEFQINFRSSGFMRQLRGYKMLEAFPVSMMYAPVEFSEIGMTAEAILRLSATDKKFTVFHPCNNHLVTMADVIYIMQKHGFRIELVSDARFQESLNLAAQNPELSDSVGGLIAYMNNDTASVRCMLDASLRFTTEALFRLGFKWPITSPDYLSSMITALDGLGMF